MQFVYRDAKEMLAKKASAIDFATTIADVVKLECHQIENFSLELSLPSIIVDNEEAIWLVVLFMGLVILNLFMIGMPNALILLVV